MQSSSWPPMGCGAGLRNKHYSFILSQWPKIDWFEAVTENFMDTGGRPLQVLSDIRAHYPVALHGVSLSIGTTDPLDQVYLKKLRVLIDRIDPFVVSDHLCWTRVDGQDLHDLLPLPMTEESIRHVVERVGQVQDLLKRRILLENISTYVSYRHSVVPEWEFLREVAKRSGCGILLDLNNIYVNSVNHSFDPKVYLNEIPGEWVGQFHLAGHTDKGSYLFDTHNAEVTAKVWELFEQALALYGPVSTLIEWDEAIPDFDRLNQEVNRARGYYEKSSKLTPTKTAAKTQAALSIGSFSGVAPSLRQVQIDMKDRISSHRSMAGTHDWLNPQGGVAGDMRMDVYAEGYLARIMEALAEVYEAVDHFLGREAFISLCEAYIQAHPSHNYNLNFVGHQMPDFIRRSPYGEKLPFLSDLARLEWQVAEAFHAFNDDPFDPYIIQGLKEEDWEKIRIRFQPSVSVVASEWPLLDIWNARRTDLKGLSIDLIGRPQAVLVYRRGVDVICQLIDKAQADMIRSLKNKRTLGDSCEMLAGTPGQDEPPVGEWFSDWVGRGLLMGVDL